MARIVESVEIDRRPEDVFTYLDDLSRHGEWQEQIVSTQVETVGPTRVGSRATDTRRLPGGKREVTYEVTEHDPPRKFSFRGLNGPVRALGTVVIEPLDGGSRSRLTLEFAFEGHGIGKLLAPLAAMTARKEIPKGHAKLKARLESEPTPV